MRSRGLPVGDVAADGQHGTRATVFDGGLQRAPQEPGPPLPEPGGGSALGPRHPNPAGEGGKHDPEGET